MNRKILKCYEKFHNDHSFLNPFDRRDFGFHNVYLMVPPSRYSQTETERGRDNSHVGENSEAERLIESHSQRSKIVTPSLRKGTSVSPWVHGR